MFKKHQNLKGLAMKLVLGLLLAPLENCGQVSRTKSLEMTSKLDMPVSVMSNPEVGKLALNIDIHACSGRI